MLKPAVKTAAKTALAAAALLGGLAALPAPALAQSGNIGEIVVFGNDPCPRSSDDEIYICARKPEAERYRIPEEYRNAGPRQSREAWASRAKSFEMVGRTGVNSCSPVGPAGFTGCLNQLIDRNKAESDEWRKQDSAPEDL